MESRGPRCLTVPNFIKTGQTVSEISRLFPIFQDGGHPQSWTCLRRIWTNHKGYLVVFITVQNLAGKRLK